MKAGIGCIVVITAMVVSGRPASAEEVFLLSYFKGNGETGVYLAGSEDGLTFTDLNGGRPVFTPPPWPGQDLTRDPSIVYRDGLFRMVWTSSWTGECFGAATSPDLKQWSPPVQVQPFRNWPADDRPTNTWAPEVHWDPVQKNYAILWSSATAAVEGNGGHNSGGLEKDPAREVKPDRRHHRTFISRTSDFQSFSDAQVFFAPGVSQIDAAMVFDDRGTPDPADDRWVMAVKNEQFQELGGKNLRLTTAPADLTNPFPPAFRSPRIRGEPDAERPFGPGSPLRAAGILPARRGQGDRQRLVSLWGPQDALATKDKAGGTPKMASPQLWSEPVAGPGSSVQPDQWVEGPTLLKVGDEWWLYFDRFRLRTNRFGLATSKDLLHWMDRTSELKTPPEARHGTIFRAPRAVIFGPAANGTKS